MMNRREFMGFAAVALGAAVVAPELLLECSVPPSGWRCSRDAGHDGPCAATQTFEFTPSRAYRPGDTITITGFTDHRYNATYVMNKDYVFEVVSR
jgi:hypothetical protein